MFNKARMPACKEQCLGACSCLQLTIASSLTNWLPECVHTPFVVCRLHTLMSSCCRSLLKSMQPAVA
jgi:hypothetical protein